MFKKGHIPWNIGVRATDEHRKKLVLARTGIKRNPVAVKKTALSNRGKNRSEESKKRMSLAKIGPRNNMYGKTHSKETKEKIRKGVILFWEHDINESVEKCLTFLSLS